MNSRPARLRLYLSRPCRGAVTERADGRGPSHLASLRWVAAARLSGGLTGLDVDSSVP